MKRFAFCHGSFDIVNNFFSGVLEATPPAQMERLEILAKAKLVPIGELDHLDFVFDLCTLYFGSDVYIRSSRHRLLCVLFRSQRQ